MDTALPFFIDQRPVARLLVEKDMAVEIARGDGSFSRGGIARL